MVTTSCGQERLLYQCLDGLAHGLDTDAVLSSKKGAGGKPASEVSGTDTVT